MLCISGIIDELWTSPARLCHRCKGVWVPKLKAVVVCKLFPHTHSSKGERCPYCTLGAGSYIYGVCVWDIPGSAEVIRGYFKKRKKYRMEKQRRRVAGISERIRRAR
jgi:hypothetical protein